jgi:hypothetical protein
MLKGLGIYKKEYIHTMPSGKNFIDYDDTEVTYYANNANHYLEMLDVFELFGNPILEDIPEEFIHPAHINENVNAEDLLQNGHVPDDYYYDDLP